MKAVKHGEFPSLSDILLSGCVIDSSFIDAILQGSLQRVVHLELIEANLWIEKIELLIPLMPHLECLSLKVCRKVSAENKCRLYTAAKNHPGLTLTLVDNLLNL
jgi:hypothetical protein